jgi:hypothetical protein
MREFPAECARFGNYGTLGREDALSLLIFKAILGEVYQNIIVEFLKKFATVWWMSSLMTSPL